MNVIGLDIGTTSISAIVLETDSGEVLETITKSNNCQVENSANSEQIQDAKKILDIVKDVVKYFENKYAPISSIGITGQMHGIVYVNGKGEAVSPLYTWQDVSGELIYKNNRSYCDHIFDKTGYRLSSGFGLVTHFFHSANDSVPIDSVTFCTIGDYVAMQLAGKVTPKMHISNVASLGLYDFRIKDFDKKAIELLKINSEFVPNSVRGYKLLGETKDGVRVSVAIGDNQASFLGSVKSRHSALINIGTGGQISCLSSELIVSEKFEIRPYLEEDFLMVASSLCGGRAYANLEKLFRSVLEMTGIQGESLYNRMGSLMKDFDLRQNTLEVNTLFCGTRANSSERGSINNIGMDNLTPQHLIAGFLKGIVMELYPAFSSFSEHVKIEDIVCSGNAVRHNKALLDLIAEVFKLPVSVPLHSEEAAYGAALYAQRSVNLPLAKLSSTNSLNQP